MKSDWGSIEKNIRYCYIILRTINAIYKNKIMLKNM